MASTGWGLGATLIPSPSLSVSLGAAKKAPSLPPLPARLRKASSLSILPCLAIHRQDKSTKTFIGKESALSTRPTLFDKQFTATLTGATSLLVCFPAYAEGNFLDQELVQYVIVWTVVAIVYFFIIPLIVYNYLRLRWYKRNFPETVFQFLLVFLFFPGMLLLAPFINFRRLPRDPSKAP